MKRVVIALVVVCIVSFSVFGVTMASTLLTEEGRQSIVNNQAEETSISVQGLEHINIQGTSSKIIVIPTEGNEVKINLATRYVSSPTRTSLVLTLSGPTSDTLNIGVVEKPSIGFTLRESTLTVCIPQSYAHNLSVKSSSGNTSVSGLTLTGFTYNGRSAHLKTDGLSVASADIMSSSGRVQLYNFAGELKSENRSGNTLVEFGEFNDNRVTIQSRSGDITLGFPDNAGYNLDAVTSSGKISHWLPISFSDKHRAQVQIGEGHGIVNLQSRSGNIRITK